MDLGKQGVYSSSKCTGHKALYSKQGQKLNWQKWLENWDMTELNISTGFLNMQWKPQDGDRDAAWDLYIELLTRITTQPLANEEGIEQAALDSVYSLFPTTRAIIREHGRDCVEFTKIAIVVLNQIVRPFTAEWHKQSMEGAFDNSRKCAEFRRELEIVQGKLILYTRMLGEMAGVERDLTRLED